MNKLMAKRLSIGISGFGYIHRDFCDVVIVKNSVI